MHSKHDSTQAAAVADFPPMLLAELVELFTPAGTIRASIATVADPGWRLIDGVPFVNAQTLAPALWARFPAALKDGADILMPNASGCTLMMVTALINLGTISGSNTKKIAAANLPTHSHTIDHTHGPIASGGQSADHSHLSQGTVSTYSDLHTHISDAGTGVVSAWPTPGIALGNGGALMVYINWGYLTSSTPSIPAHDHTYSANTQGASVGHTHWTTIPALGAVASGTGGFANTDLDITNKNLGVNWQIKAH